MSSVLRQRLVDRIGREGPITFAEFMRVALYDPEHGFYSGSPVGREGHFITSPHVSAVFGELLAAQCAQTWEALGRPDRLDVVELGAGDGTLAAETLAAMPADLRAAARYVAVEQGAGARARIAERGVEARASLDEVAGPICGIVLSNELLDNLPFHRLRRRADRIVEVMVGAAGEDLVEREVEPSAEALASLRVEIAEGEERPVSPATDALLEVLSRILERGHALLFDYGIDSTGGPHAVRAFAGHRLLDDVLADPGSRDVTGGVDWDAVASSARDSGFRVWGPVSQRDALLSLGYRSVLDRLRERQHEAERSGDHRLAIRLFGQRSSASILTDPAQLGGHRVLALGKGGLPAPSAVPQEHR